MFASLAQKLDAMGLRRLVAPLASMVYKNQSFSVDADGRWVNRQPECTIVSQGLHTQNYAAFSAWVQDHWLHHYTPREGDVFVDVGAGLGEEAAVFSRLVGASGSIYSIEAHPGTFACLEKTIALSGLDNVTPIHCALADEDGEATIGDDDYIGNSILRDGKLTVPQRSLRSLAQEIGLTRIDYLRMNIEGAERLAVRGMDGIDVANVCISCHDFCGLPSKAEVVSALTAQGYAITTRDAESGMPWTGDYIYARKG